MCFLNSCFLFECSCPLPLWYLLDLLCFFIPSYRISLCNKYNLTGICLHWFLFVTLLQFYKGRAIQVILEIKFVHLFYLLGIILLWLLFLCTIDVLLLVLILTCWGGIALLTLCSAQTFLFTLLKKGFCPLLQLTLLLCN